MVLQATVPQAYVRWCQNERRKDTVSPAFTVFPTVTSVTKSQLEGQERIWSSPYFDCRFPTQSVLRTKYRTRYLYYNPIKRSILFRHLRCICYGEAKENSWEQIFSAGAGASSAKHYGNGCRHQPRLRANALAGMT